jgi:hypothetical protein
MTIYDYEFFDVEEIDNKKNKKKNKNKNNSYDYNNNNKRSNDYEFNFNIIKKNKNKSEGLIDTLLKITKFFQINNKNIKGKDSNDQDNSIDDIV